MIRTYLINLDKNVDRLHVMDAQLTRLGLGYERVEAVSGKELSPVEVERDFAAVRSFLAMGVRLTRGEIGCALSHGIAYSRMEDENLPVALVLEDDVVLGDGFLDALEDAVNFVDVNKPQVVLFSAWNVPEDERRPHGIVNAPFGTCADAYLITLPAARLIRKANYPVVTVADRWSRWRKRLGLELYRAFPTMVSQDNDRFGTDVDTWTIPGQNKNKSGLRMLAHKFCRVFELSADWLLWKVTGR